MKGLCECVPQRQGRSGQLNLKISEKALSKGILKDVIRYLVHSDSRNVLVRLEGAQSATRHVDLLR